MSPLRSSAGPAVCTNGHVELVRPGSGPARSCPGPGGPASRTWSSASPRARRGLERDRQLLAQRGLADELLERARAQRAVELVLGDQRRRRLDRAPSHQARRAPPQRVRQQLLGRVAVGAARAASRPRRARSRARAGRRGRARAARRLARHDDRRVVVAGVDADLLAQLDDDPLGRPLADRPARPAGARRRRRRARATSSRGEPPRRARASATFGPDALDADEQLEQVALLLGGEAVERQRVVAHDQVGVQRDVLARRPGTWRSVSAETASR